LNEKGAVSQARGGTASLFVLEEKWHNIEICCKTSGNPCIIVLFPKKQI
jgi:hypothetical protein